MKTAILLLFLPLSLFANNLTNFVAGTAIVIGTNISNLPSGGGGGGGNFVKVFNTAAVGNAATATTAPATNSTGCSVIFCCVGSYGAPPSSLDLDNKGNTYTLGIATNISGGYNVGIYYKANPTVGTGHTWSITQGIFPSICVIGFSGGSATPTIDQVSPFAATGNVATIQPGSITPGQANEVVIVCRNGEDGGTVSVDSSFTISDQVSNGGGSERMVLSFIIQTSATAVNPTFSWSVSGNAVSVQGSWK